MKFILVLVLLLFLVSLLIVWVGFASAMLLTSRYELKKRAQKGDIKAQVVYGFTANGREVYVAILLGVVANIALITLVFESFTPTLIAAILTVAVAGVGGIILPFLYADTLGINVTVKLVPIASKIVSAMSPLTRPLAKMIDTAVGSKSILYSKEQLIHSIDDHARSAYGDITIEEARLMKHSLSFGQKTIYEIMIPRKVVTMVASTDLMGPILMDELHKSGHSRFPVYDGDDSNTIVGTLYLKSLVGEKQSGPVKKLMSNKVFFVHEELDLMHALDAFIKTKH
ncbi:DUF21 domain-containing protein, partial [bacterium]|nr:DUF21 domain-containing protein [bacterium]